MTTRTTPKTDYRGIIRKSGRGVHPTKYISDNGRTFDNEGVELFCFDVDDMEEIETLDGDWVYRNALNEEDDPGIDVFVHPRGTYRSVHFTMSA